MKFWTKIFSKGNKTPPRTLERIEPVNGIQSTFTPFSGNAYESDVYRAAVDAIARNAAKLKPAHVVTIQGQQSPGNGALNRILQVRPNPYMSTYDLIYKLVTHYYLYNNAFAYLQKSQNGYLTGIYPIRPQHMEYLADQEGNLFCQFILSGGKELILRFDEVLCLKRFFNSDDLLGDRNGAILPALSVAHAQNEGLENYITNGATIRGFLKYMGTVRDDDLRKKKKEFAEDYLNIENSGGFAMIDNKVDYIPVNGQQAVIDSEQMDTIKTKVYDYLGISEKIVNSTYTEDEWAAFYESVIEPLALQISLELTDKVFTPREQAFGNSILLEANRLQFASNETKTNILKELMPLGLLTVNQALEILNMPAVADGDRRVQTLNVVSTEIVDQYQMKGAKGNEGNKKLTDSE